MTSALRPGPRNDVTDVPGLRVGSAEVGSTGSTVVLCDRLTPAAVDRRGGGPATRETDALAADASVRAAHGIVLSGGSVFGLAAADAVAAAVSAEGGGLAVTPGAPRVPLLPAACLYDLGQLDGGAWPDLDADETRAGEGARAGKEARAGPPYATLGRRALAEARLGAPARLGAVGAGRGARTGDGGGRGPGGLGAASLDLGPDGMVAALIAANPVGAVRMAPNGPYWAWPYEVDGEFGGARPDPAAWRAPAVGLEETKLAARIPRLRDSAPPPQAGMATVIGVVAVSAALDASALARLAIMAQDGLALAVAPAHTPFDGDTLFALATGTAPPSGPGLSAIDPGGDPGPLVTRLGRAAAICVARAVARGCWLAETAPASHAPLAKPDGSG